MQLSVLHVAVNFGLYSYNRLHLDGDTFVNDTSFFIYTRIVQTLIAIYGKFLEQYVEISQICNDLCAFELQF